MAANFVGTLNTIPARVLDRGSATLLVGEKKLNLSPSAIGKNNGESVNLAIRPEALRLGAANRNDFTVSGAIEEVQFLGSVLRLRASVLDSVVSLDTFNHPNVPPPAVGEQVAIHFSPSDVILLED